MAKFNLSNVLTVLGINSNFQKVEDELNNKVLYRDNPVGEPNTMETPLDMNGERIFNLPLPLDLNEPARLSDIQDIITGDIFIGPDAGSLTGSEEVPIKRGSDVLKTTMTAIGTWIVSAFLGFAQTGAGAVARTILGKLRDVVHVSDYDTPQHAADAAGGKVLVLGDAQAVTVSVPSQYADVAAAFAAIRRWVIPYSSTVTIQVAAGTYDTPMIEPYHPYGKSVRITGAGSGSTTLRFTLSAAASQAAVKLEGSYTIGPISALTLDGNDWAGHSDGGPTLGAGNANDPIAFRAREGAVIFIGADVKVRRFARHACFAYDGATILADSVDATECGSDSFVASLGATVRAISAQSHSNWGVGFFADYGGVVWATSSLAEGAKLRGGTSGGQGFSAVHGGIVYADSSTSKTNAREGYLADTGGKMYCETSTAGGGVGLGNGAAGYSARNGGKVYATSGVSTYNATYGVECTVDGTVVFQGGATDNNTSDGIRCLTDGYVFAQSIISIANNGGFGIFGRSGGIVDAQGVSIASKVTGNTGGTISGTQDTGTGLARAIIYINA